MHLRLSWFLFSGLILCFSGKGDDAKFFQHRILPILDQTCFECHEPGLSKGDVEFLSDEEVAAIQYNRSEWRSVAAQLMNRTMPPPDKEQPGEEDRMEVVEWIEDYLRRTACDLGPYAGNVTSRRLNRLEYDLTIRDLLGVDLGFSDSLPMESGGGEGFDNNGETLFLQPMLMERFVEAAQQIADYAVVSPRQDLRFERDALIGNPKLSKPGQSVSAYAPAYLEMKYRVEVRVKADPGVEGAIAYVIKVDEQPVRHVKFGAKDTGEKSVDRAIDLKLVRGTHAITITAKKDSVPFQVERIRVHQWEPDWNEEQRAAHVDFLGVKPGMVPGKPREAAAKILKGFLPKAFRRPASDAEVKKYLTLYDRAAERNDPWEERMKLVLKGILVSPEFLFRIERSPASEEIQPVTDHELAARLSYFLWSSMPDEELRDLAKAGKLQNDEVLSAQVERMITDPKSLTFSRTFVGQWLGTKDVGGRIAPITNELQETYTVDIAGDMREEPVRLFHHLVQKGRPLTDLIDSDYTFMTKRLAKFLDLKGRNSLKDNSFHYLKFHAGRRGGVLGMASVLAATSHYKETSAVLRGAWVFDTLIGSPVPPPPPNVPPLGGKKQDGKILTEKERLELHRDDVSCKSCHELIDPIGFGLQNFDYLGRWRETLDKKPIETAGRLPTGETFSSPAEMRKVLAESRREEFLRHITRQMMGYALGRGIDDRDDCTITQLVNRVETKNLSATELVKGIVLSVPFRNRQIVEVPEEKAEEP